MLGTLFFLDPLFGKIAFFDLLCVLLSRYFWTVLPFFLRDFFLEGVGGGEVDCDVLLPLLPSLFLLSSYFWTVLAFFLTDFLEEGVKGGEVVCDVLPSLLWVLDVHKSIIILLVPLDL